MDDKVKDAIATLEALPPEELRQILSNLASATPDVVYWPKGFLRDFPVTQSSEGDDMEPHAQAAMMLSSTLAGIMHEGEVATFRLGGISHGNIENGDWEVQVHRVSGNPLQVH